MREMLTEGALTEVVEGVFELRLPIPFEDGLVNVFLFADGREADLLDCGMNSEESVDTIKQALTYIGAKRLRNLVVTHIHPDHYGAAGVFAGPGLADLYIHRLEVPLVHPRYVGLHPQSTPDPLHEYLDGLRRLAAYEPELILPAHGRPYRDAPARVKVLEAHHRRRLDQIVEIVGRGKETGWEVALELWGPREHFYEKRLLLKEGWRICRRWRSTTELLSPLRPKPCAGRRLDAKSEQLRRVAADTHHARTGVCSDDWAQGLDHQRLGDRLELAADSVGVPSASAWPTITQTPWPRSTSRVSSTIRFRARS